MMNLPDDYNDSDDNMLPNQEVDSNDLRAIRDLIMMQLVVSYNLYRSVKNLYDVIGLKEEKADEPSEHNKK